MGELSSTINQRLSEAYEHLRAARAEDDTYLTDTHQAEIDDLRRIAQEHGIEPQRPHSGG